MAVSGLALWREQVEENFRFASAASIAGVFNATIAVVALWSQAFSVPLLTWYAAILSGALFRVSVMRRTKSENMGIAHYVAQKKRIAAIALYNGTVWGIGAAALSLVASFPQYVLLIILCSGMMGASVTTYTSQAKAGALFTIPLGIGGLFALWASPYAPSVAGTLFLACYIILLVRGGFARQERFNARIRQREQLRESAETVKLLLNDYEQQSSDWLWQIDEDGKI